MSVRAVGQLQHGFFGDYVACVALGFESEESARACLPLLGAGWKLGEKTKKALVWGGEREALEAMKKTLARYKLTISPCSWEHCTNKCAGASIDGVPHSIDYGPRFSVEFDVVVTPPEQISLFPSTPTPEDAT